MRIAARVVTLGTAFALTVAACGSSPPSTATTPTHTAEPPTTTEAVTTSTAPTTTTATPTTAAPTTTTALEEGPNDFQPSCTQHAGPGIVAAADDRLDTFGRLGERPTVESRSDVSAAVTPWPARPWFPEVFSLG